jgi:hypothetical protein
MSDIGSGSSSDKGIVEQSPLTAPFAIYYDVGVGLDVNALASMKSTGSDRGADWDASMDTSGVRTTKSTYFDKATRTCKICTIRTTKECKKGGKWSWNRNDRDCKVKDGEEECKEVKM